MTERKSASPISSGPMTQHRSDLIGSDAHVISPEEYDEIPEVTDAMIARGEVGDGARLLRRGRPIKPDAKEAVSIRLSPLVVAHFRARGPGWQTRINDILLDVVEREGGRQP